MRIVFQACLNMRGLLLKGLGFAIVNHAMGLLDPLMFRFVIDRGLARLDELSRGEFVRTVGGYLLAAIAAAFVARFAKHAQDHHFNMAARRLGSEVLIQGVQALLQRPYGTLQHTHSGEAASLLQRVRVEVEAFATMVMAFAAASIIGVAFVMIYSFTLHPAVGALFFATAIGVGWLSVAMSAKVRALQRRILRESSQIDRSATEVLRNVELVKSLGLEAKESSRLAAAAQRVLALEGEKSRYIRRVAFIQGTVTNLVRMSIMALMLYLIFERVLTVGEFFSLFVYAFVVFVPLQELGTVVGRFRETQESLQTLSEMLDDPQHGEQESGTALDRIEQIACDGVAFRYDSGPCRALEDVTLVVNRGETIAIVGESGAGKTTLLKVLLQLYQPSAGTVRYNDMPGTAVRATSLRRRFSVVTQEPQLFGGSIRYNLLLAEPDAGDEDCWRALTNASCDHLASRSPFGLDTDIGECGALLSRGERQRLALARALIRRPDVLVLDEATASLDALTEQAIVSLMTELRRRGETIAIAVTHRLATIRAVDRIYVLQGGRIAESGTHGELLARRGAYHAMWCKQDSGVAVG